MVFIWILKALACVLIVLLLIIMLILFAPIRYKLNAAYEDSLDMRITASWILRAFTFIYETGAEPVSKFKIFGRARRKKGKSGPPNGDEAGKAKKPKGKKAKRHTDEDKEESDDKSKGRGIREILGKFMDYPLKEALIKKTLLFIKRVLKAPRFKQADCACVFGFDDPSATGIALGAAHTALGLANLYRYVTVSADFEKKYLCLNCHIMGKITLWSLLWPFMAYTLSKPVWIILKPMIFKKRTKG